MSTNAEVTAIFRDIADLLDLAGEKFKPEAYRRAARSIESLTEDLKAVAARNALRSIPGVGEAIAEKIREYLATGKVAYYDKIRAQVPPGVLEMMRVNGVGPKTARRFWAELGVEGPAELVAAIDAGRLKGLKGFGPRKISVLKAALDAGAPPTGRLPLEVAYGIAEGLVRTLREDAPVDRVEAAGSFRRRRETVGDLDLLVTSREPQRVFDLVAHDARVKEVKLRGPTKETVVLVGGLQVDVRVVAPDEFGAALLYFTGSKDHNIRLRSMARDRGLKVNEYGVFEGDTRRASATEEEVYGALGLPWIPPELRENQGEVEAALAGRLPVLIEAADLRGDLHVHLPPDATVRDLDRLIRDAQHHRFEYLGVVAGGLHPDGTRFRIAPAIVEEIRDPFRKGPKVFLALEESGEGPVDRWLRPDYWILAGAEGGPPRVESGAGDPPLLAAHLGRAPRAGDAPIELSSEWLRWAREAEVAVEVGAGRDSLDSRGARTARERGIRLCLATGLGGATDDPRWEIPLGYARRAGAAREEVLNASDRGAITGRFAAGSRSR